MGNDKAYVYGRSNGAEYEEKFESGSGQTGGTRKRTHWDPRIEVTAYPGMDVQIGIVPATRYADRDEADKHPDAEPREGPDGYEWFSDNGQFMQLDRSGLNRLIEALQEAGAATFGRDRW